MVLGAHAVLLYPDDAWQRQLAARAPALAEIISLADWHAAACRDRAVARQYFIPDAPGPDLPARSDTARICAQRADLGLVAVWLSAVRSGADRLQRHFPGHARRGDRARQTQ